MGEIPDSTLMAYADGELDPELRGAVEDLLAVDPVARERLAAFTGTRPEKLAPAFDAVMRALVVTVPAGAAPKTPPPTLASAGGAPSYRTMLSGLFNPPTMAWVSIALALAVGVGVGFGLSQATIDQPSGGAGLVSGAGIASGALRQALEGTPTNTVVVMKAAAGETLSFRAVLSFLSKNDRYCRHYEIADRGGAEFAGLACQTGENNWQVEIYARTPARGVSRDGLSIPAGIPNAVESAVLELMPEGGGPLVGEPEEDLIRNGWRASK